ncbi:MAG: flagellar protein FlaG [Treponema sp.]|nr:flagellar protein FlaG [Treponema sp.]
MSMQMVAAINESAYAQGSGTVRLPLTKTAGRKISAINNITSSLSVSKDESEPLNVDKVVKDLEQISFTLNKKLKFTVDHESHEIFVKVIDRETDKVVKILPPEELRRIHGKIKETIGILFDELI